MTFRIGFNDGTSGYARVVQDPRGKPVLTVTRSNPYARGSAEMQGQDWKIWHIEWMLDSLGRPIPGGFCDELSRPSITAIRNVVDAEHPGFFLNAQGDGGLGQYFHPVDASPRFRFVYGAAGNMKTLILSLHDLQPLPGYASGTVERPRFMILGHDMKAIRSGDLQDLILGRLVEMEQLADLTGDPMFQELVAGRFMNRLRQMYPTRQDAGPGQGSTVHDQLGWLDRVVEEQKRIQGPEVFAMIAAASKAGEVLSDEELEQAAAAGVIGKDIEAPPAPTDRTGSAFGPEF